MFDCSHVPAFARPKLGVVKKFDLRYKEYLDNFDLLFDTFSRDAVDAGSIERLSKELLQKHTGDFALDKRFLEDLSGWREDLARDIFKHPKNRSILTNDYVLNECVQRILDRIVFFRVCEDREIEVEDTLLALLRLWQTRRGIPLYSLLNDLFKQKRSLYNGLLFNEHPCEQLEINDKILLTILENLNYPFSPYQFSEIGVEILGSIYEKFLGKTIHAAKKNVRVEEKPEVRKAGGVYYTPQYIVEYIVDHTLGKLLYETPTGQHDAENKKLLLTPKQVAKLKVIDIACGSGSFLLGAFQELIEYHLEWYRQHPEDNKKLHGVPDAYTSSTGDIRLSSRKKRELLLNNIYGVDIDRQAVEVTQMSLYLKVLEGESADTLNPQMTLALKEVYLPSLNNNIKCGNSLIGTDFYAQEELFVDANSLKINAFDWENEFPAIMKGGGFDVVIGNPPYVFGRDWKALGITAKEKNYFSLGYKWSPYQMDMFSIFMEKGFQVCKTHGSVGQIVPNVWLTNTYSALTRKYLLANAKKLSLAITPKDVFDGITVDTIVYVYEKSDEAGENIWLRKIEVTRVQDMGSFSSVNYLDGNRPISISAHSQNASFIYKIKDSFPELKNFSTITRGVHSYRIGGYGKTAFGNGAQTNRDIEERPYHSQKQKKGYRPFIYGKDLKRFSPCIANEYILYGDWLAEPRQPKFFEGERIYSRKILGNRLMLTIELQNSIADQQVYITKLQNTNMATKYIGAILGSKFMSFFIRSYFNETNDAFPQIKVSQLQSLPIRTIDFEKAEEKKMHDDLVGLVEKMLALHKELNKATFDSQKEPIERQISATDNAIDRLVYMLYNLTEEDIAIVEGKK